jgi:pimeloyl-ACP methyl ester carboxylesterase
MARRGGGRLAILTASGLALALLAGACAFVPRLPVPRAVEEPSGPCAVAAIRSCALPYPSDEFTVADPTTATGRRVEMPAGLIAPRTLERLGPGASPADAFDGADGFAALSPVVFELDRPVRPSSLPADGGDVLVVYDLEDGAKVPIRAEVSADSVRHGAPDTIVMAWPAVRWEPGRTYVARLGEGLRAHDGSRPARAPRLDRAEDVRRSLARLEGPQGWASTLSATQFTIRSRADATAELDAMAGAVRAAPHGVRRVSVQPPVLVGPPAAAVVTGEVELTDFRDDDGVARVANGSRPTWVPFTMVLPREPAGPDGAPVVIYGHGLTISKESMLTVAATNARHGLATIGIDVPNHGDRQAGQGGYLLDLTTPKRFGRLASMPLQGVVDQLALLLAVQGPLAALEYEVPAPPGGRPEPPVRLDASRVLYQGTSMGGVLGAAFVALAPELLGAFLHVPGTGIADIILHSLLWPVFMDIVPSNASAGDAAALKGAASMLLDPADNVNVLDRLRSNGTPLFVVYGANDGVVPNWTTDRLLTLAGLPLTGRQLVPVTTPHERLADVEVPADGRGAIQLWPADPVELQSLAGHLVFTRGKADRLLGRWLEDRLAASGLPRS